MDIIKEEPISIKVEETQETYIIQEVHLSDVDSFASTEIKKDPDRGEKFSAVKIKEEPASSSILNKSNFNIKLSSKTANNGPVFVALPCQPRRIAPKINLNIYRCTKCTFETNNAKQLENHVENHHSKIKTRSCLFCKFKTEDLEILKEHLTSQHKIILNESSFNGPKKVSKSQENAQFVKQETFKCNNCNFTAFDQSIFSSHNCATIQAVPLKCKICNYETNIKKHFHDHMKTHNDHFILLKCPQCTFVTRDSEALTLHRKNHTLVEDMTRQRVLNIVPPKPVLQCLKCPYRTDLQHNFALHMKNVHLTVKNRACMFCKFTSFDLQNLREHIEREHKVKVNNAAIDKRDQIYWNHNGQQKKTDYRLSPKIIFKCSNCNCTFLEKSKRDEHKKSCQTALVISPLKCKFCSYETHLKKDFGKHMESHSKVFKCIHCNYKNVLKQNVEHHMRQSHKIFKCDQCLFTTLFKPALIPHLQSHLRASKFLTEQRTSKKKSMQKKMLRCSICHYQTTSKVKMNHHMKYHDFMFSCDHCSYTSRRKDWLAKHIKTHVRIFNLNREHKKKVSLGLRDK